MWVFLRSSLKLILGVIKRVHWGVTPENYNRICARRCLTRLFERRMSQIAIFNPVHMGLQGLLVSNAMFQRSTRPAICGVNTGKFVPTNMFTLWQSNVATGHLLVIDVFFPMNTSILILGFTSWPCLMTPEGTCDLPCLPIDFGMAPLNYGTFSA